MKPYALVADVHAHNWSQFSSTNQAGVNTRLQAILDELVRAAETLLLAGGNELVVAGDLFHTRGKIEPSVFNPTVDTFRLIADRGVRIRIIPGNHDLEGKHASQLGNAMQQLQMIDGVDVAIAPLWYNQTIMLPWIEDLDELRAVMKQYAGKVGADQHDLIIHAPLNGVIKGLPDHGLDPVELAVLGFRRVFVGHYHNHAETAQSVYSIGATTHQTWSDPGTRAGFLIVYPDRVEYNPTQAPRFIDLDFSTTWTAPMVKGNFIRLQCKDVTEAQIKTFRAELEAAGAAGIVDHSTKKREITRGKSSSTANVSLEVSVANYVGTHLKLTKPSMSKKRIAIDALDVLREARTIGAE